MPCDRGLFKQSNLWDALVKPCIANTSLFVLLEGVVKAKVWGGKSRDFGGIFPPPPLAEGRLSQKTLSWQSVITNFFAPRPPPEAFYLSAGSFKLFHQGYWRGHKLEAVCELRSPFDEKQLAEFSRLSLDWYQWKVMGLQSLV